jgi:hypothetical protein
VAADCCACAGAEAFAGIAQESADGKSLRVAVEKLR